MQTGERERWYRPAAALGHAAGLPDGVAGRCEYGEYLTWLTEHVRDEMLVLLEEAVRRLTLFPLESS